VLDGLGVGLEFVLAVESGASGELDHAAGIRTGDLLWGDRVDVTHLRGEDLLGHLVFNDVVDARGAAADIAGRHLDEFETGDEFEEFARSCFDLLAVAEMA